jgi:hypothetical protein
VKLRCVFLRTKGILPERLGLHIAIAALQPRQIQQHTWQDIGVERHLQAAPAR